MSWHAYRASGNASSVPPRFRTQLLCRSTSVQIAPVQQPPRQSVVQGGLRRKRCVVLCLCTASMSLCSSQNPRCVPCCMYDPGVCVRTVMPPRSMPLLLCFRFVVVASPNWCCTFSSVYVSGCFSGTLLHGASAPMSTRISGSRTLSANARALGTTNATRTCSRPNLGRPSNNCM